MTRASIIFRTAGTLSMEEANAVRVDTVSMYRLSCCRVERNNHPNREAETHIVQSDSYLPRTVG